MSSVGWHLKGDYFENCSCDVTCPCLFSSSAPMTATPTAGACEVPIAFHIDEGRYGDVVLDDLNVVSVFRTPGPMADGNGSVALYLDERADDGQREALQAIFSGAAGGPVGLLAPLVSEVLGIRSVPIRYVKDGNRRSVEIPGIAAVAVRAIPSAFGDEVLWVSNAHPFAKDGLALAVGDEGSTWSDYGLSWDNSGKNAHFAEIAWSSA